MGLKLTNLCSTMADNDSDSYFSSFSQRPGKVVLGTIILSPDLRSSLHYMATFDPDQDLGLFQPK